MFYVNAYIYAEKAQAAAEAAEAAVAAATCEAAATAASKYAILSARHAAEAAEAAEAAIVAADEAVYANTCASLGSVWHFGTQIDCAVKAGPFVVANRRAANRHTEAAKDAAFWAVLASESASRESAKVYDD